MTQTQLAFKKAYELIKSIDNTLKTANNSKDIQVRNRGAKTGRTKLERLKKLLANHPAIYTHNIFHVYNSITLTRISELGASIVRLEEETWDIIDRAEYKKQQIYQTQKIRDKSLIKYGWILFLSISWPIFAV